MLDKNIAIEFNNVGKQYRLGLVGTGSLQHDLNRWWQTTVLRKEDPYLKIGEVNDRSTKGNSDYVWALKDINFKVEQGDVVGIIGKNGAGKSTLLKLLSHITAPTVGDIRYRGRIASLLEVGTGFHPEMTARQNIYMNGSIMGMTRHEIDRKLDEIVDFAGIERYLDTPVKRFSSGMTVRLGFAVAAFLEPEILVVDEVLAVGDAEFQKKAIGKMKDVSSSGGRTVLFVSHNMAAVQKLCNNGIVLKNGLIDFRGNIKDSIEHYLSKSEDFSCKKLVDGITLKEPFLTINEIRFNDTDQTESTIRPNQEYVDVEVSGETQVDMHADLMVIFTTTMGTPLIAFAEGQYKGITELIPKGDFSIKRRIKLPKYLSKGDVAVNIHLHQPHVCTYLLAEHCAEVHIDGSMDDFCQPLEVWGHGSCGLESIPME